MADTNAPVNGSENIPYTVEGVSNEFRAGQTVWSDGLNPVSGHHKCDVDHLSALYAVEAACNFYIPLLDYLSVL